MKAQILFEGLVANGAVQIAQGTDGRWFQREYGFNGYGKCWLKWQPCTEEAIPSQEQIEAGQIELLGTYLKARTKNLRVRLPN